MRPGAVAAAATAAALSAVAASRWEVAAAAAVDLSAAVPIAVLWAALVASASQHLTLSAPLWSIVAVGSATAALPLASQPGPRLVGNALAVLLGACLGSVATALQSGAAGGGLSSSAAALQSGAAAGSTQQEEAEEAARREPALSLHPVSLRFTDEHHELRYTTRQFTQRAFVPSIAILLTTSIIRLVAYLSVPMHSTRPMMPDSVIVRGHLAFPFFFALYYYYVTEWYTTQRARILVGRLMLLQKAVYTISAYSVVFKGPEVFALPMMTVRGVWPLYLAYMRFMALHTAHRLSWIALTCVHIYVFPAFTSYGHALEAQVSFVLLLLG